MSILLSNAAEHITKTNHGGSQRSVTPEQTLARLLPLMPKAGVTRIANVTGLDCVGIPVVMVCRPNSRGLSVAQGKGLTLTAAKVSGLMETLETYHAERITHPLRMGSYIDLRREIPIVDIVRVARIEGSHFRPRHELPWIEGFELIGRRPLWLPYESVEFDARLPRYSGTDCFSCSTNGLAAGNHVLEAVVNGMCEVIERDAVTLWELQDDDYKERLRVDLATVTDCECRWVLDRFAAAGIGVGVWDVTSDIGVPAYVCFITEQIYDPLRLLFSSHGDGCHPTRKVALLRALTEAAQGRLTVIAGTRDDNPRNVYVRVRGDEQAGLLREKILNGVPRVAFTDRAEWNADTFNEDIAWMLDRLQGAGIREVVVVDLTREDLGVPVVRVVVPGLECAALRPGYHALGRRARQSLGRLL